MIYLDKSNEKIEKYKQKLGLKGHCYVVENNIESYDSHLVLFPNSTAKNIYEAEQEMENYVKNKKIFENNE